MLFSFDGCLYHCELFLSIFSSSSPLPRRHKRKHLPIYFGFVLSRSESFHSASLTLAVARAMYRGGGIPRNCTRNELNFRKKISRHGDSRAARISLTKETSRKVGALEAIKRSSGGFFFSLVSHFSFAVASSFPYSKSMFFSPPTEVLFLKKLFNSLQREKHEKNSFFLLSTALRREF